jgi:hypothetical protein
MRRFSSATSTEPTIDQRLRQGRLPMLEALRIARRVVVACAEAESRGETFAGPLVVSAQGELSNGWVPGVIDRQQVGARLFHVLTGVPCTKAVAPSTLNPGIDDGIDAIILSMLRGDGPSLAVVHAAFDALFDELDLEPAAPEPPVAPLRAPRRGPARWTTWDEGEDHDTGQLALPSNGLSFDIWAVGALAFAIAAFALVWAR